MKKHFISRKPEHRLKWMKPVKDKSNKRNRNRDGNRSRTLALLPIDREPVVYLSSNPAAPLSERDAEGFLILKRKEGVQ